jgi:hypothetical protein
VALRGIAPRRDQLIAASLTGAVVIVVGYASGLGLKPGMAMAENPPALTQPPPSAAIPLPGGEPPPPAVIPSLPAPAVPVTDIPAPLAPPTTPGGVEVQPTPPPPPDPVPSHPHPDPPSVPPPSVTPPPDAELPACEPAVAQQVLDTVAAIPLLGGVTGGLGVTGADGLGATLLGYCRAPDGTVALQTIPVPAPVR